ncbi:MAG TPA: hypothetical protein VNA20_08920 [Frankiaceae bacterium]|nr:hypothetical protein [Frankiaceae bacterium]
MTQPPLPPGSPGWAEAASQAALASRVRPSLVLDERVVRELLGEAARFDVAAGGRFSAGPAGIQVWTGPWNGELGGKGDATHLGSVDWTYDTPARGYVTIYRSMVTQAGLDRGETTESVLTAVLNLVGQTVEGPRIEQPMPPAHDPFRRRL